MFGKAHARCTQKQGQAECRKRMGEQVYNKVAAIICLADWPRTDSAQWCLAGEMKQRLLVVGGAELLVLLHKGRQVDVLLQELLVQLLRLFVQLCHWCWGNKMWWVQTFHKIQIRGIKVSFFLLFQLVLPHIHWVATVPFKLITSTKIEKVQKILAWSCCACSKMCPNSVTHSEHCIPL